MSFPKVILKKGKEKSIQRRHPWIFSGAVYGVSREINDGEMVDVVDSKNNHLGTGYFSDKGSIVVRILTFGDETFSENFWNEKLQSAWYLRTQILDFEVTWDKIFFVASTIGLFAESCSSLRNLCWYSLTVIFKGRVNLSR